MFYLFPTFSYSIANYIRLTVWMAVIWKNAQEGGAMCHLESLIIPPLQNGLKISDNFRCENVDFEVISYKEEKFTVKITNKRLTL